MLAKRLNELCGCAVFHAWNVMQIPDADLDVLNGWAHIQQQQARERERERDSGG